MIFVGFFTTTTTTTATTRFRQMLVRAMDEAAEQRVENIYARWRLIVIRLLVRSRIARDAGEVIGGGAIAAAAAAAAACAHAFDEYGTCRTCGFQVDGVEEI